MSTAPNTSSFVISLDFELHWGVRDHRTVDQYRQNLLGVRQAIPMLLSLFEHYGIRATWATVGFLFFENREELQSAIPAELPVYQDARLDPYPDLPGLGRDEAEDPCHFAPSLIREILRSEGQELATHTFSHFYTQAHGPTLSSFREDLRAAKVAAEAYGTTLKSIVFPRNQITRQHIRVCAEEGIIAYRSTEADPLLQAAGSAGRIKRLADNYIDLSGDNSVTAARDEELPIVRISQSRFLRPWSPLLSALDTMRLDRVCGSMRAAAANEKIFHLWWHPHNFGLNIERNIAILTRILECHQSINRQTHWPSLTMAEIAETVLVSGNPS